MLPLAMKLRVLYDAETVHPSDDCYWLLRCQGFAVYDQDGRVGTVRRVRFGQLPGEPSALVVRTGLLIHRIMLIPTADIDEISAPRRRIVTRATHPRPAHGRHATHRMRLGGT